MFTSSKKRADCAGIEAIVTSIATKFKGQIHTDILDLEQRENRMNALQFKVSSAPALVLNGERIFAAKLPSAEELSKLVEAKIGEAGKAGRAGRRYWSVSGLEGSGGSQFGGRE